MDREKITPLAEKLTPLEAGADYASAIMDLGATLCTPAKPDCPVCPWKEKCLARKKGIQEQIPLLKKTAKKKKNGAVFILQNGRDEFFIRKRTGKGLLTGLWELPWTEDATFPFESSWEKFPGSVHHVFTHVDLTLEFYRSSGPFPEDFLATGLFIPREKLPEYAFSTLMKKVLKNV